MKRRVLVLCTGNSARSQIVEGLLRSVAGDKIEVFSAGTHPKGLNPLAVQAMQEIGIDISRHQSKDVSQFEGEKFDVVITVCDHAKEHCPAFPGARMIHWSTPDPAGLDSFRKVRDQLTRRVEQFVRKHLN